MKTKLAISLIFLSATLALAMPIKLTVQPKGANQIQLTFGPVTAQDWYQVWVRTNGPDGHWMLLSSFSTGSNTALSVTTALGGIPGLTTETLTNWTFVAGKWDDSEGDELPMIYKELALRTDPYAPADPYGDPMGDGWNNVEKMKNNMAPYKWCTPRPPQLSLKFFGRVSNSLKEQAILTWQIWNSAPDYFVIERAHQQSRQPFSQNSDRSVTGPFAVIAQIPSQPGAHDYQYTDTNADISSVYQIQSHYPISHHAHLDQVNADSIRKTILTVTARQTTNGYTLIAMNPIPDAWYLLLVRDKNDPQWRASGYFTSGTNRAPVYLHVDKKGMMSDGQSPISMPNVHFLPDVVEPEFTAGWGEDSDGDGLPDIYEVLVTHTDPDNADTGNAGILDGYKEMTDDGWNNLEKFRRRIDPLRPAKPSATMELKQPTGIEIIDAITPKTDLSCELEIAIRTNGATDFQPIEQVPSMLSKITNFRQPKDRRNFDLRISWRFTKPGLNQYGENLFDRDSPFQAIESLLEKTRIELAEQFKAKLAAGPALSPSDLSNNIAGLFHDYRQDGMDKGVAMVEMMALRDNQSQDYYGQVVDQYGQPVVDADVTAHINLTMGEGETFRTRTDANGSFQFTGIRGKSLSITPSKTGFQIDNAHLGL
ncbi:MAG TPA: carboxypeptidase-like regulatory domain-containing protein, partial [Candidatus Acidoferrum sp.]|nr:carboxypeptidase-like regulatory domain-containing protein [Candidatus Acidoferrum sp.]